MSRGGGVASKENIVGSWQASDKPVAATTVEATGVDAAMWDKVFVFEPPSDK